MNTKWDYTDLAEVYKKRPGYSPAVIDEMLFKSGMKLGSYICDIGAGVAHLTIMLIRRGAQVTAIEPNDAMRTQGIKQTQGLTVIWFEGTGEDTGRSSGTFDMVTFGSSFNVTDQAKTLSEASRILKPQGWIGMLWNHRDLNDPIQQQIEKIIKKYIPGYQYGTRRKDPTAVIEQSKLFKNITPISADIIHTQQIKDVTEAWKSHATLQRQSGDKFLKIIEEIELYLIGLGVGEIDIPYTTRAWIAQKI